MSENGDNHARRTSTQGRGVARGEPRGPAQARRRDDGARAPGRRRRHLLRALRAAAAVRRSPRDVEREGLAARWQLPSAAPAAHGARRSALGALHEPTTGRGQDDARDGTSRARLRRGSRRHRVLLVEANPARRRALGEIFGFKPPRGFGAQLQRHRTNPNDAWVVVQIGNSPLYVLAAEPRCCPHCAAVLVDEARFCGMCGKSVPAGQRCATWTCAVIARRCRLLPRGVRLPRRRRAVRAHGRRR